MTELDRYWPSVVAEDTSIRVRLLEAYGEPHRGYHNAKHLAEVFARIDEILGAGAEDDRAGTGGTLAHDIDLPSVLLAAWFHDAVYQGDRDDEERSADLAERELTTAGAPLSMVAEVVRLVRVTETHEVTTDDINGQVLCDADLGILAADDERYREYTDQVRREYQHIGDDDFRQGRAQVLRKLLEAPTLFHTTFARQHWETVARANVERELAELEPS